MVASAAVADALVPRLSRHDLGTVVAARTSDDRPPAIVLLDRVLAEEEGLALPAVVEHHGPVPVVMFSSRPETVADRVRWLHVGVHDFVPWPSSPPEVAARLHSVLRRRQADHDGRALRTLSAGGLVVDVLGQRVTLDGRAVRLTSLELKLLVHFMCHPGEAVSREELLRDVWGYEVGPTTTVTVHVRRLREKLEPDAGHPTYVTTIWGVGYRFEPTVTESRD